MVSSRAVGPDQLASACSPTPSPRWLGLNDNHNVQLPPLHPSRESFSAQGNQQSQGVTLNGGVRHSSLGRAVPPPERMRMVVQEQNQDLITHQIVTSSLDTLADGSHPVPPRESHREGACITTSARHLNVTTMGAIFTPFSILILLLTIYFDPVSKLQKRHNPDTPAYRKPFNAPKQTAQQQTLLETHYNYFPALHGYPLEPLLGSLSRVAPQQEPRPPLFSRVQYGNGILANQPVAPQLELYFPYTGTDSLSVSTCQLPQANTSPLGMLYFERCFDTTRGRLRDGCSPSSEAVSLDQE